ncbi:transposase [Arenicella xantha]|uniref:REP element-mobilizing transposase RayT n=1 Tax=Arenicella xantha TaxID=644221 RepID=A0A395JL54_9GAMM|nr:transposase [Arenicella xantha]RBP49921.1 REP element-mobilizing transposase RayT [Arenicella xantha]
MTVLGSVCERYNWVCHAYCLMSNHYHLLIETPDGNLSKGMRQLNGVYTQTFNQTNDRVGHVFQGRYKGILVEKQSYLLELARYIVLNPVRAHMVHAAGDWPWSSYRATSGISDAPKWLEVDWLLASFSGSKKNAIKSYRNFVMEGKGQPSPWAELRNQVYLGSSEFVTQMVALIDGDKDLSEIPSSQRRPKPRTLKQYFEQAQDRNHAIVTAYKSGGYTLKEIGSYFGLHYTTVSGIVKNYGVTTKIRWQYR